MTMKTIAELAQVSPATVSRTFHSPHLVDAKTRNLIMSIAEEHQYVYNATAANLSRKQSTIIGVLLPHANRSFFGTSLIAIQDKAQENGYAVIIGNTKYDKNTEKLLIEQFMQHQVAGMILTGCHPDNEDYIHDLIDKGTPCVFTWETFRNGNFSYVGFDNHSAAFKMTEYLIGLGHRRIGLLIGPYFKSSRISARFEGYKAALKKHNIAFDQSIVITRVPSLIEGREATKSLVGLSDRPTAIFAASDSLAIGALTAVKDKGLKVPEDISIAGFDNVEFASHCDPPLTTVQVPAMDMGHRAMETLLDIIGSGVDKVRRYDLETDLIIRDSCLPLQLSIKRGGNQKT
ncbi:MAG: LacI family DNA-binding transcriptional regulator [Desulfobacterales bacterium]|nr:LacI family DNA-binding transcriptional regulator [Desulfobacterales bacterium]